MNATGRGAANEPDKHRDNSHQHRFPEIDLFYAFLFNQYVQTCRTFKSRAASDVEESAAVCCRIFSISFRNIQRYGCRSPVQLIVNGEIIGNLLK